jgi:hypothetical protein
LQPFLDGCPLLIRRDDFDRPGFELVSLLHQAVGQPAVLVNGLDRDLERIGDLFDEDLGLGGHPGPNRRRRIDDFDDGGILFDRGAEPAPRFGIAIDSYDPSQQFHPGDGVNPDLRRHPLVDQRDT